PPITAEPPRALAAPIEAEAPPARQGGPAAAEIPLPRAGNGVLPAGVADKVLPIGAQPIVKLLDSGAEPRADLSYALTKGTSQKTSMAMDTTMSVTARG